MYYMYQYWRSKGLFELFYDEYRSVKIISSFQVIIKHFLIGTFNETCKNVQAVVVIVWQLDLQLPVQTVYIITNVVRCTRYNIKCYMIKLVSDLRQDVVFLRVLRFSPPADRRHITEILLKVPLNTITLIHQLFPCCCFSLFVALCSIIVKWTDK